jgi:hypothetical protein
VSITVTALVYSGRLNPEWQLPPAEAAELERRLEALAPTSCDGLSRPGLGYSGLLITIESAGRVEECRVANGLLEREGRCFCDPDRTLEKALLRGGAAKVDNPLLGRIVSEIG